MFFNSICTSAHYVFMFSPCGIMYLSFPVFSMAVHYKLCIPCWRCPLAHTVLKLVSHLHASFGDCTSTPANHSTPSIVISLKPAIWTLQLNYLLLSYFIYWLCKCSAFHRNIILSRRTKPLKTSCPLNHCVYLYGVPILCATYLD